MNREHQMLAAIYREGSDAELLNLLLQGDRDAFSVLMRRKLPLVLRTCQRVGGSTAPREDLAGDVFLELLKSAATIDKPASLNAWLQSVAHNRTVRWLRRKGRTQTLTSDVATHGSHGCPETEAQRAEVVRRVRQALATLPAADRDLLMIAGLAESDAEAAALQGLPVATYRTRLHRARQRARVVLERFGLGPLSLLLGWLNTAWGALTRTVTGSARLVGGGAVGVLGVGAVLGVSMGLTRLHQPFPESSPAPASSLASSLASPWRNAQLPPAELVLPTILTNGTTSSPSSAGKKLENGPPLPTNGLQTKNVSTELPQTETLEEFNARQFRDQILPPLQTALGQLLEGSTARIVSTQFITTRVQLEIAIEGPHPMRLWLTYDMHSRSRLVLVDLLNDGRFAVVNNGDEVIIGSPTRPLRRWTLPGLTALLAVLARMPTHPDAAAIQQRERADLERDLQAHRGTWEQIGRPARRWTFHYYPPSQYFIPVEVRWGKGELDGASIPWLAIWRGPDGRVRIRKLDDRGEVILSTDGSRMDGPHGTIWHRVR